MHPRRCKNLVEAKVSEMSFVMRDSKNKDLDGETLTVDFALNAKSLGAEIFSAASNEILIEALEKSKKSQRLASSIFLCAKG